MSEEIPVSEYFADDDESGSLFEAVASMADEVGPHVVRATRSQVAFRRRIAFAWVWVPRRYLHRSDLAPLVLTIDLHRRDPSARWKSVVEPRPGRFTHHLEVRSLTDLDDEVRSWLREAWEGAE